MNSPKVDISSSACDSVQCHPSAMICRRGLFSEVTARLMELSSPQLPAAWPSWDRPSPVLGRRRHNPCRHR